MSKTRRHSKADSQICLEEGTYHHNSLISLSSLQWRHNERDGVSNHQPHDCSTVFFSGADQSKRQSSASLAFVWGIHRWSVNSLRKGPVTRKIFPFDDVIMWYEQCGIEILVTRVTRWLTTIPNTLYYQKYRYGLRNVSIIDNADVLKNNYSLKSYQEYGGIVVLISCNPDVIIKSL